MYALLNDRWPCTHQALYNIWDSRKLSSYSVVIKLLYVSNNNSVKTVWLQLYYIKVLNF